MLRRFAVVVLLAAVLVAGWVGVRGYLAVRHLDDAAARVTDLQEQLLEPDLKVLEPDLQSAAATVELVRADTAAARELTSDPVWKLVARFPWGGQNLRATGTAAAVGDRLAGDALPSAVAAAGAVAGLRASIDDGDLGTSAREATTLSVALVGVQQARDDARADLDAVDRRYLLPQVRAALADVEASLALMDDIGTGLAAAQ